jgi:predicted SAM-dependent methyltransferase
LTFSSAHGERHNGTMMLIRAADGTTNLHVWREGQEYLRQKGPVFLNQWNNVIFATVPGPTLSNTRYVDLSTADLEFADGTFDAVYAYHVFEHLSPSEGERCARQLFRVLKAGGICRVSVPDLETACRHYLDALHTAADRSTHENLVRYRWATMEIFEQMVRDRSGGRMSEAIARGEYDAAQLQDMFGDMLQPLIDSGHGAESAATRDRDRTLFRNVYRRIGAIVRKWGVRRIDRRMTDLRFTKEAVRWMYDRLSLRLLLEHAGLENVHQVDHLTSSIPRWSDYDLDRSNNGDYPLDPSVYCEGAKPVQ